MDIDFLKKIMPVFTFLLGALLAPAIEHWKERFQRKGLMSGKIAN